MKSFFPPPCHPTPSVTPVIIYDADREARPSPDWQDDRDRWSTRKSIIRRCTENAHQSCHDRSFASLQRRA